MSRTQMSDLIHRQAEKYGERVALKFRNYDTDKWESVSWNEFSKTVDTVSNALIGMGVESQENLGVFSQNMPECLYTDFGAYGVRAVTIPFYATNSESQVHYMINDAKIRYLFVGEQYQYDVAYRVMTLSKHLKRLIIFDRHVVRSPEDSHSIYFDEFLLLAGDNKYHEQVESRKNESDSEDMANILYTSGTTGESKGVRLSHRQYEAQFEAHKKHFPKLNEDEITLDFLPFTHIFERGWAYLNIVLGATLAVNLKPRDIQKTMREIRPTTMCSVPRFWEKVYEGVMSHIESSSGMKRKIMLDAIEVGKKHNLEYILKGKKPPKILSMKYKMYEKTIYSLLRKQIGIENGRFFPVGGGAIPHVVEEFTHAVGINIISGYGLTESLATVSCETTNNKRIGSVGKILPGVEVKIGEDNEILLKGASITRGYYHKEAETKAAFTEDGWFRTGDAGYFKDGFLYLTDRIKDLFKTSNGKYIAPQAIESRLVVDRFIDQITIVADMHKFVSALIVPNFKVLEKWAENEGMEFSSREQLVKDPKVIQHYWNRIDTLQQQFAHYEQIKKFVLLPHAFSMKNGELTNTLKIKRRVVAEHYKEEIDKMYAEPQKEHK